MICKRRRSSNETRSLDSDCGIVVIFLAVLLVFGSYVSAKNQMVTKREAVTSSWGEVNNQLQRRSDLIPNLVETVKGMPNRRRRYSVTLPMRAPGYSTPMAIRKLPSRQRPARWGVGPAPRIVGKLSRLEVERELPASSG